MEEFDYIIVGGGTAGCVLAARLSQQEGVRVLLLEAGSTAPRLSTLVPGLLWSAIQRYDWRLPAEPDISRGGAAPPWIAGKILGGGSSINGMMFVRGLPEDYDAWADAGGPQWAYDALLPSFRRLESFRGDPGPARGTDGPVAVEPIRTIDVLTDAFIAASAANGMTRVADVNSVERGMAPVGRGQTNQDRGRRASTARAYLGSGRSRGPGLTVRGKAHVQRIVIEKGRAVGVQYSCGGRGKTVGATREVIVCAGAFGSPKLLQLSGVGATDTLREVGIAPIVHLPGVGEGLTDHPMLAMKPRVTPRTYNSEVSPLAYIRGAWDWLRKGTGLATVTLGHAIGYARSCEQLPRPDLFLAFSPLAYDVSAHGLHFPREPMVTIGVGLCRPFARGSVRLRSPNAAEPPRICLEYLSDERDRQALLAGYAKMQDILSTVPLSGLLAEPLVRRIPDLAAETFTMYHPAGTCRMGPDEDPGAVLDAELRVRGVEGLRVVDASAMPAIPSGNIHAPVIMLAEHAAALIMEDTRSAPRSI